MASITLLCAGALSGCVGGAGNYFETVSRENLQNRQIAKAQQPKIAAVEPVSSSALPPIGQQEPNKSLNAPATTNQAQILQTPASRAPITLSQSADGVIYTAPNSETPASNQLANNNGFNPNGPTGLTPLAGQPIGANLNSGNQSAYADAYQPNNAFATSGFAIGSQSTPVIDPLEQAAESRIPLLYASIQHGQCKQGRGPTPKKITAQNINPGDKYYIEIRMRRTPLLPVGHTYVAYGRLGADGSLLDEKLIMLAPAGGYAGAALASGIPMPGILNPHPDDCRIRPEAAYRVSLNAQRYEKLLLEIQKARNEKPRYLLFAYNCNHFMTRIAKSVGIKPPKNIYVPALEYIYAMIENNEGHKVSRR